MWIIPDSGTMLGTEVLADSFVGTNGTLIPPHAPQVGGPWTTAAGTPQIQSNQMTGPVGINTITAPITANNFAVSFNTNFTGAGGSDEIQVFVENSGATRSLSVSLFGGNSATIKVYLPSGININIGPFAVPSPATSVEMIVTESQSRVQLIVNHQTVFDLTAPIASFTPGLLSVSVEPATTPNIPALSNLQLTAF